MRGHVERRAVAARAAVARQASIGPRARQDGTAACMIGPLGARAGAAGTIDGPPRHGVSSAAARRARCGSRWLDRSVDRARFVPPVQCTYEAIVLFGAHRALNHIQQPNHEGNAACDGSMPCV